MSEAHIDRVLELYANRASVDKEAYLATYSDIEKNDFNLNIPRYVDSSEEEQEIDLKALTERMRETDQGIRTGEAELLRMMGQLTFMDDENRADVESLMDVLREV